jgi:hypothetical protein
MRLADVSEPPQINRETLHVTLGGSRPRPRFPKRDVNNNPDYFDISIIMASSMIFYDVE